MASVIILAGLEIPFFNLETGKYGLKSGDSRFIGES